MKSRKRPLVHLISPPSLREALTNSISPDYPDNPLGEFLHSQEKVHALEVALVLPAHGAVFTDHRARARQLIQHHHYRREEIRDLIRQRPKTAHEIAQEVFGVDNDRPLFHTIAATFETLAHLHLLLSEGRVRRIEEEMSIRFLAVEQASSPETAGRYLAPR